MAAPNAFRAYSVTWKAGSLTTIENVSISQGGQAVDFISDGSAYVSAVFVDNIAADITVVLADFTQTKALSPGDNGALVVTYQLRAEGKGAAGSGNAVATFSSASLVNIQPDAATGGVGRVTLTFRASAAGGSSIVTWT